MAGPISYHGKVGEYVSSHLKISYGADREATEEIKMILTDGKSDREVKAIKLRGDNLLVEVIKDAETTESGIYIGRDDYGRFLRGVVYFVSDKITEIGVGDRILFSKNRGVEYKVDGRPVLVVQEKDVWAVVEEGWNIKVGFTATLKPKM